VRCLRRVSSLLAMACIVIAMLGYQSVAATEHAAALIVIKGDGSSIWITVPFTDEEISGADLLQESTLQITTVSFGGLGIGVCGIEQTGCDVANCRKRLCQGPGKDDPFWQYFVARPDGTWTFSPLGINADKVHDGDVRAFIWSADPPTMSAPNLEFVIGKTGSPADGAARLIRLNADGLPQTDPASRQDDQNTIAGIAVLVVFIGGVGVVGWRRRQRTPAV